MRTEKRWDEKKVEEQWLEKMMRQKEENKWVKNEKRREEGDGGKRRGRFNVKEGDWNSHETLSINCEVKVPSGQHRGTESLTHTQKYKHTDTHTHSYTYNTIYKCKTIL